MGNHGLSTSMSLYPRIIGDIFYNGMLMANKDQLYSIVISIDCINDNITDSWDDYGIK